MTPHPAIRTLIIAKDMLTRMGLSALLEQEEALYLVGQVAPDEALALEVYRPHIGVWLIDDVPPSTWADMGMPTVFLLSDMTQSSQIFSAMRSHLPDSTAWGMLPQTPLSPTLLISTIKTVHDGMVVLAPNLLMPLLASSETPPTPPSASEALTTRESQVLQLMAEGLPNKQIAQQLGISTNTVKFHVNAILSKLNAQSRTEAVIRATQLGWVLL